MSVKIKENLENRGHGQKINVVVLFHEGGIAMVQQYVFIYNRACRE